MDNIPVSDVSDELQCPVCLLIPREVPIPACPVGHIVCKDCRVNVTTCPTCRRHMLKDGTNTLANKMIERVPHPCKFSPCQVKNYLNEIKEHEARCPERTIKCPHIGCKEQVKVSEYQTHAMTSSTCNDYNDNLSRTIRTTFVFDQSIFNKTAFGSWRMRAFEQHGKLFYFHQHFFAAEKIFALYVTMAEDSGEAKKYLAKMTLKIQHDDDRKSLSIAQNVISMELAPSDRKLLFASESVMFVHWKAISGFMKWMDVTEDGEQYTRSSVPLEVTISILDN